MDHIFWENNRISKFVLGTAQLGLDYGIANVQGKPTEMQAYKIIEMALAHGVNFFDTAQAYGNSEIVLGKALKYCNVPSEPKITSKISPEIQPGDTKKIEQSILASRQNLGVEQLWCLMLHRADWFDIWDEGLGHSLINAKKNGTVKYIGVSVYSVDEACRALSNPNIQVVQVPCNVWDQKMHVQGVFEFARNMNKICFVRSIYCQGLLVLDPYEVARRQPAAGEAALKWHNLAKMFDLKPEQLAVRYGLSLNMPLVIGVEDVKQVISNLQLLKEPPMTLVMGKEIKKEMSFVLNDNILDPRLW